MDDMVSHFGIDLSCQLGQRKMSYTLDRSSLWMSRTSLHVSSRMSSDTYAPAPSSRAGSAPRFLECKTFKSKNPIKVSRENRLYGVGWL